MPIWEIARWFSLGLQRGTYTEEERTLHVKLGRPVSHSSPIQGKIVAAHVLLDRKIGIDFLRQNESVKPLCLRSARNGNRW